MSQAPYQKASTAGWGGPEPFATRVFVALAVAKLLVLAWLWWHRLPHYGADAIQLRQPAVELVNHGRYLLPTVFGVVPHAETFFAAYPPGYALLNALVMSLGGTGLGSYLLFDLGVHGLVSVLLAALMWRAGAPKVVVGTFLLAGFATVLPIGRPEELGVLLLLAALALTGRATRLAWVLAGFPAGGALAVGPVTGAVVVLAVAVLLITLHGRSRRTLVAVVGMGLVSGSVLLALWGPLIWGHWAAFFEQFAAFREASYLPGPIGVAKDAPGLVLVVVLSVAGVVALVPIALKVREWSPLGRASLLTSRVVLPVGLLLNLAARRPHYDYRLLALVGSATFGVVVAATATERWRRVAAVGAVATLGLGALLHSVPLLRFALAPIAEPSSAASYDEVLRHAQAVIPAGASVGGDGAFLALNARQSVYADLNISNEAAWPEFIVSSTWAEPPYAQQREKWRARLAEQYVEVPVSEPYTPGCALRLGPLKLPIAKGTCAWNVRVWRKASP